MGSLFLGWLILGIIIPVLESKKYVNYSSITPDFWVIADPNVFAMMIFGIMIPTIIFGYIHKRSAVCATHSLPLKRECIFFSHIVSSAILLLAPVVITALLMMSVNAVSSLDIMKWIWLSIVYFALFGGMALLSSSIAGNIFSALAIPAVILLLPVCTTALFEALANEYLLGYTYMSNGSLVYAVGKWYMPYSELIGYKILIYIAVGLIFAAIGFICFKKRALENNSSVTVFKVLNPIFMYGVAFYGGLLGAIYIDAVTEHFSIWLAIPFGIVGIILARMLILKTFRPKNIIKPSLIYILSVVVLYAFFGLDITGFEKRIPDINDVASVSVYGNSEHELYYYDDKGGKVYTAPEAIDNTEITNTEDIKKVIALHKDIVSKSKSDKNIKSKTKIDTVPIYYTLKNGKVLARAYNYIRTDERKEMRDDINDIPLVKAYTYPVLSDAKKEYTSAIASAMEFKVKELSTEEIAQITEALRKDISSVSSADMEGSSIYRVDLTVLKPTVDENGTPISDKQYWHASGEYYYVRKSYKNTIGLLKEWGIYDALPTADDVNPPLKMPRKPSCITADFTPLESV
jgi:ABC-2 type transport system permease protein